MVKVTLNPLTPEDGEIISHDTIEQAIDGGEAYRIIQDGQLVGGVVILRPFHTGQKRTSLLHRSLGRVCVRRSESG